MKTEEDVEKKRKKLLEDEYDDNEIDRNISNMAVTKYAKGVKSSVVKKNITFDDYVVYLESLKLKIVSQNLIRSDKRIEEM